MSSRRTNICTLGRARRICFFVPANRFRVVVGDGVVRRCAIGGYHGGLRSFLLQKVMSHLWFHFQEPWALGHVKLFCTHQALGHWPSKLQGAVLCWGRERVEAILAQAAQSCFLGLSWVRRRCGELRRQRLAREFWLWCLAMILPWYMFCFRLPHMP